MSKRLNVFFVATFLLSTSVGWAADANTPIECGETSTFYPLGYLWSVTPPRLDNPIALSFFQGAPTNTGSSGLELSDAKNAVMRAFSTWESTTCDSVNPNIPHFVASATDHPTLDQGDVWDGLELVSHKNVVYWDNTGDNPLLSSGTVAYTLVNFFDVTAQAIDGDMMFNDSDYSWRVSTDDSSKGCTAGDVNCFDIETVALHEAGHLIAFGHVNCAESVMFPTGVGASSGHELSEHEKAGACALYPPRVTTDARATGESCEASAQCPANHSCLQSQTGGNSYGRCVKMCTIDTQCADGFYCGTASLQGGDTLKYCAPGLGSGQSVEMGDLCMPCSSGTHCQSGLCLEVDGNQFCSQPCNESNESTACPAQFSCIQPQTGSGFCWPDDPSDCGLDTRPVLNDLCYAENGALDGSDFFDPCGPGLICMGFRPLCQGLKGACVLYCDTGTPCQDGLTCCYGIDDAGHCMGPRADATVGGCFDIRAEGEACVTAEQSVCREGFECVAYGEATAAKCYEKCPNDVCVGDEYCLTTPPLCDGMAELKNCCSSENLEQCVPGVVSALREVGMSCNVNADCFSGLCLKYNGVAACSRSCDAVTGIGCPGDDADVNGDGLADGGFDCLLLSGEPRCWPKNGPIGSVPPAPAQPSYSAPSGCCRALGHPLSFGDLLLSGIVWLPFALTWLRSRRRWL